MKIMLDAGHGPETLGKQTPDGKLKEFEFNQAVVQIIKRELECCGVIVMLSHPGTSDVPLSERTNLANKLGVQAFISIHANAFGSSWNNVSGIETFTYTKPSEQSKILAKWIQDSLCSITNRSNRGVKQANFAVLRDTIMPAVLVECGFMTNNAEAALLQSSHYRNLCAKAIAYAILCWKQKN
ncbi:N-acetylmuramoyl-L-alanine amidase [Psychrobacillus vulpis]|uniref:N-acetylmuramoyl-L-alanine amidase n=1 Tax=Psychrobacillus vulpis TaxID=2325572 RepID=A0A544TRB3_9BACI|nr:N-acetylmuramoyl-L-alanine amidase [Psychrobacillus vulpis]TQR19978.1 N-acetylmuramoyl-L-alanine amidase [Psychrobacillus vulpis]